MKNKDKSSSWKNMENQWRLCEISIVILFCSWSSVFSSDAQKPLRIISLAPNITEILFALHLDNQIVGVTDFCNYPPESRRKTRIGGYMNLNLEIILSLKPNLIIMLNYNPSLTEKFDTFHIKTLIVNNETIQDIRDSIVKIGAVTEKEVEAQQLVTFLNKKMERYRQLTAPVKHKLVLFIIGRNPGTLEDIYAVGGASFLNELMNCAGGVNILSGVRIPYPKISQEEIVARNPDIIIEASPFTKSSPEQINQHQQAWHKLAILKVVKNNQIYFLEQDFLLIPGPRISQVLDLMLKIIHPDIYQEVIKANEQGNAHHRI